MEDGRPSPAVYIDPPGHLWSADVDELHRFAAEIGMHRNWFQDRRVLYHYDVMTHYRRMLAVRSGAIYVTSRELVGLMRSAARS